MQKEQKIICSTSDEWVNFSNHIGIICKKNSRHTWQFPTLLFSIHRLRAHQACAFCGEFCAHGTFLMCRPFAKAEPHMFHKTCWAANGKICPHCNSADKPLTVLLKLSMDRVPLSLLETVSKISFVKKEEVRKNKLQDLRYHPYIT